MSETSRSVIRPAETGTRMSEVRVDASGIDCGNPGITYVEVRTRASVTKAPAFTELGIETNESSRGLSLSRLLASPSSS